MIRRVQSVRRISLSIAALMAPAVIAVSLVFACSANALRIGHTSQPVAFDCIGPSTYLQQATAPGSFSYTVPAGGGLITSWETVGGTSSGAQVKLAVFRPTGIPGQFTTVGSSAPQTIRTGPLRAGAEIPVLGGETIGLLILFGAHQCALESDPADIGQRDAAAVHDIGATFTYSDPNDGASVNVSADVLPAPRTLTLKTSKKSVRRGKKVRLSGQVSSVNSEACAFRQPVTVERTSRKKNSKMSPIAEVRTDTRGRFALKSKVKATSKFRAELDQTSSCGSAESKRAAVKLTK